MWSIVLILSGLCVMYVSGFPELWMSRDSTLGQKITVTLLVIGCLSGLTGTISTLFQKTPPSIHFSWALPMGQFSVSVDKLSAFFLILIFLISGLGSIYGLGYWKQKEHRQNGHKLSLFYGMLSGSLAMIVIAHNGILFLIAWESMALSAFFCLITEDDKEEVRRTAWIYFVATHIGTLLLFALFAQWNISTGSFELNPIRSISQESAVSLFLIAFLGFGFKAGFMPLHVWLPGAHANAPSHVSALMSGVVLKMGIYGIIRITGLIPIIPAWWGWLLLAVGIFSGIFGIIFALVQSDFKRLLAYSSIENVGIIVMGIGLALLGRAYARMDLVFLGMGAALFHIWNHGLFKPLLFFTSGAVIHATGTRNIELMGGLKKKMPVTALLFIVGAIAICALPPLNGFAGEWLLYIGLFKTLAPSAVQNLALAALAAAALAMIGALAAASFVKLYSTTFLGLPRSHSADHAHDPEFSMILPMAILAVLCVILGIIPFAVLPLLESAVRAWAPLGITSVLISDFAPIHWISGAGIVLLVFLVLFAAAQYFQKKNKKNTPGITWDCGYYNPTEKMQYTGNSFSQPLAALFSFALLPLVKKKAVTEHFPKQETYSAAYPDTILDKLVLPFFKFAGKKLRKLYLFQQGQTHLYVLYVLIAVIIFFSVSVFWGKL